MLFLRISAIPVKILAPRGLITTRRARARRPQDGPGGRSVGRHKLSRRLSRRFLVRHVVPGFASFR